MQYMGRIPIWEGTSQSSGAEGDMLDKQSVLSIEDLLLPGVVHTYTITDVHITARNQ